MATLGLPLDTHAVGILSEPGSDQRLVVIPDTGSMIAKVGVRTLGKESVLREAMAYSDVLESLGFPAGFVPRHQLVESVLLIERMQGVHPSWDDVQSVEWIRHEFISADGVAIPHGDLTPWNVFKGPSGFRVIDWEEFDVQRATTVESNILDFVLRGAAVKAVSVGRVKNVIRRSIPDLTPRMLDDYRYYRNCITENRVRSQDALSRRVDSYLIGLRLLCCPADGSQAN